MKKSYRKPFRYKKKKPFFKTRFFWLPLLGVILLAIFSYFFYFFPFFQIKNIEIGREEVAAGPGVKMVSEDNMDKVRSMVETASKKKMLFLETKSIFIFPSKAVGRDILENIPEMESVAIDRHFLKQTMTVSLTGRKGIAVWCQEESCFLADKAGIIFEEIAAETELPKIINQAGLTSLVLGGRVIDEETLEKISSVIASVLRDELAVSVKEFVISLEDRLIARTVQGWEIYFSLTNDIVWQLTKLKTVLEKKIPQDERDDLEYIDVQFGNFAPFKYR